MFTFPFSSTTVSFYDVLPLLFMVNCYFLISSFYMIDLKIFSVSSILLVLQGGLGILSLLFSFDWIVSSNLA